jgi:primosomal protein N'
MDKAFAVFWNIPVQEILVCPECKESSPFDDWAEDELPCETCGIHPYVRCPKCDEYFDAVKEGARRLRETNLKALPEGKP